MSPKMKHAKGEIVSRGDSIDRFSNELKFARKVAHRNICKMHDLDEKEQRGFYAPISFSLSIKAIKEKCRLEKTGSSSHSTSQEKLAEQAGQADFELIKIDTFVERDNIYFFRLI